jgi:hypothetical protein
MNQFDVPLCLDIIGTLTQAHVRHERSITAFKESPPLRWLFRRRRANKGAASRRPRPEHAEAKIPPLRAELLQWLREQHAGGRRLVLVADGNPQLAQQIAAHLGLFDEVARTEGAGTAAERKRRALVERFGEHGFDYGGSNASDMIVWEASQPGRSRRSQDPGAAGFPGDQADTTHLAQGNPASPVGQECIGVPAAVAGTPYR